MPRTYICPFCHGVLDEWVQTKSMKYKNYLKQDYVEIVPDKDLFRKRWKRIKKKYKSQNKITSAAYIISMCYFGTGLIILSIATFILGIYERNMAYTIPGALVAAAILYTIFAVKDKYEYEKTPPGYTQSKSLIPIRYFDSPDCFGFSSITASCNFMEKQPTIDFAEIKKLSVTNIHMQDLNGEPEYRFSYNHDVLGLKNFTIPMIFTPETILQLFPNIDDIEDKRRTR